MNGGEPDESEAKTADGRAGQSEQEAMVVLTADVSTTACTGGWDIEVRGGGRWGCLRCEVPCR